MTSSVTCWIFIAISALLPACTRSDAPVGDAGTPPAPAVSMTRNDCFKASLELDRMLLEAGKSCASDGDCDCYNGGLMMRGCQWVARKEPLAQLKRRESALLASGCAPERTCPAFACRAACVTFRGEKKCLQRGGCEQTAEAFKEVLAAAPVRLSLHARRGLSQLRPRARELWRCHGSRHRQQARRARHQLSRAEVPVRDSVRTAFGVPRRMRRRTLRRAPRTGEMTMRHD